MGIAPGGTVVTGSTTLPVAATQSDETTQRAEVPPAASANNTFVNRAAGMQFDFPAAWHPVTDDTVLSLAPLEDLKLTVDHVVIDKPDLPPHLPGWITVNAVQNGFIGDLKRRYNQVQLDSTTDRALDGVSGHFVQAHGMRKDGQTDVRALLIVRDDRVYVIDAEYDHSRADRAQQAFEMVVNTWRWVK